MLVTHTESKQTINWYMTRKVEAGPAPVPEEPLGKSWRAFMGKLPFVIGYEAGMKEARFTGRAPMFFVTSHASPAGRGLGEVAFGSDEICKSLAGYTPILIDGATEKAFMESRGQGNVLADPTLLWEDLDGDNVFTMVGGVPDLPGVEPAEFAKAMFDIPARRTPDARPSEGYKALIQMRDRLRAALAAADRQAVVAAVLQIQGVGLGVIIQKEAATADAELKVYANGILKQASALLGDKTTAAKGRELLEMLAKEFAGHSVADKANALLSPATPTASK